MPPQMVSHISTGEKVFMSNLPHPSLYQGNIDYSIVLTVAGMVESIF
jgi:hypothetical protein